MIKCPKCKVEIEEDSIFCDQCGQELRYCSSCGKPGKGKRCTYCGEIMIAVAKKNKFHLSTTVSGGNAKLMHISETDRTIRAYRPPKLFFVNSLLNIRIEAKDGAIIGRKTGIYKPIFCTYPYVSGTHAILHYDILAGWTIIDKNSSNGTYVEESRLQPETPCAITDGTRIRIANIELIAELI